MLVPLALCALALLAIRVYRRTRGHIVAKVRGPPSTTWYGPALDMMQGEVGETFFPWQEEYGGIVRIHVPITFGFGDILLISDPKALRHMHQTAFSDFGANNLRDAVLDLTTGQGIATSQGQQHVRQHKIIQPGFGVSEIKSQIPAFSNFAVKLSEKWADLIAAGNGTSTIIDVTEWNIKFTLDCMGTAVLNYQFGALDGREDPMMEACQKSENIFVEAMGQMLKGGVISMSLSKLVPSRIYKLFIAYSQNQKIKEMRAARDLCETFAARLIKEKTAELMEGKGKKDTMSLVIRANASSDPKARMSDHEMVSQVRTFLFAANSTLAHTEHWMLYELARHPGHQQRLKDEIRGKQVSSINLDSLPFLNAFVKEILRFHPVAFMVIQEPKVDTVLPLAEPIMLETGEVVDQLPIPKGQNIVSCLAGYNRLKSIWGEDANEFNPGRWLREEKPKTTGFGMHSNLASFLGGPKGCTGWRMAVVVLQVYLFEMASRFKFGLAADSTKIRRQSSVFMLPQIEGEPERGICLPLVVELYDN